MTFKSGQRVRLNRDLAFVGFQVPAGSSGTVSTVEHQTHVLFDDFDHPLAIADSDISAVRGTRRRPNTAGAAADSVGVRVVLRTQKVVNGVVIPVGSRGTITQYAATMNASWVLFDGYHGEILIPNRDLQAI